MLYKTKQEILREMRYIIKWVGRITSFVEMNTRTPTINASFPCEKNALHEIEKQLRVLKE